MNYTPERLREWADWYENEGDPMPPPDNADPLGYSILRAHADALEKLKVAEEALETLRDPQVWKRGGAGGQDQYAGLPPALRIVDATLAAIRGS